jgi:hypothetical protein
MKLPSIRSRLTRLLVGVAVAWGWLTSARVWLSVSEEVDELLDDALQASADVLGRLLSTGGGAAVAQLGAASAPFARRDHFAWQLVGPGGQVLLRSDKAPAQPLAAAADGGLRRRRQRLARCTASACPTASACSTWRRRATNAASRRPRWRWARCGRRWCWRWRQRCGCAGACGANCSR